MALQASKTCEVWIPLNSSVLSSGCWKISNDVFPHFSLFLNSDKVFSRIFTPIHCFWMPFTVSCFPFCSVILGFLGYHWFPLFAPLGTRTNVVSATLMAGPFLILHYLPFWRFPLQKPLADFPVLRGPRKLTFDLSFSKASRFHIFRPTFWLLSLLSFSQVSWFLPTKLENPQPPSFMVLLSSFPEVPNPYSWVVGSQVFWSLFCIIGWLIGTYMSLSFVFLCVPPWNVLIPTWPCCTSRRSQAPGIPKYPSPVSFPRLPNDFYNLWELGWTFFFPSFYKVRGLLIHGFKSLLMNLLCCFGP